MNDDATPTTLKQDAPAPPTPFLTLRGFLETNGLSLVRNGSKVGIEEACGEILRLAGENAEAGDGALPTDVDLDWSVLPAGAACKALEAAADAGLVNHAGGDEESFAAFADVVVALYVSPVYEGVQAGSFLIGPYKPADEDDRERCASDYIDMSEDPFFGDDEKDEPFAVTGDEEEMTGIVRDIVLTSPAVPDGTSMVRIAGATEEEGAAAGYLDENYQEIGANRRDQMLFSHLVAVFEPTGYEWQYNDGARDRRSGYYQSPADTTVDIEVTPTSCTLQAVNVVRLAATRVEARRRLSAWVSSTGADAELVAMVKAETDADQKAATKTAAAKKKGKPAKAANGRKGGTAGVGGTRKKASAGAAA